MQQVLDNCEGVKHIYDDIIAHGKIAEEHDKRLQKALEGNQKRGLTLNKENCEFKMPSVEFMGHLLSARGTSSGMRTFRCAYHYWYRAYLLL